MGLVCVEGIDHVRSERDHDPQDPHQQLTFRKLTKKVHGKTVAYNASVSCLKGKRPWSITFQANNGGHTQTSTVKGSSKC